MANPEHMAILEQGVEVWNRWRLLNHRIKPELSKAELAGVKLIRANLSYVNFAYANLEGAHLNESDLHEANFSHANLSNAILYKCHAVYSNFFRANCTGANLGASQLGSAILIESNFKDGQLGEATLFMVNGINSCFRNALLNHADFTYANLKGADLSHAKLIYSRLIETNLKGANLNGCWVYGTSVWGLNLDGANQSDLLITHNNEPAVTVDNIEVAQFIYLLLHNEKLRDIIDNITSKVVLILGRFTPERKAILDAIREVLRRHNYSPVLFDFDKPASRDLTETISLLARMARFVIADLTDPMSIPHELASIVPTLRSVPVVPIIQGDGRQYGMFADFQDSYPWVLPTYRYHDLAGLLSTISTEIIGPAECKVAELRGIPGRRS